MRALTLLSGGLDSQLAVCVLREQGIEVQAVAFESPFFDGARARKAAAALAIPLQVVDFSQDILALLKNPRHGFGSCMNPCIDCHARMLKRAGDLMTELGSDFLSTGEVLNERPMSQNRRSLDVVARDSGYADLVLRPLSARLLAETQPERLGQVDRSRLLSLSGRSRKPQMALAARYGLTDYPSPAGGCLLTEPSFCRRLKDLQDHGGSEGMQPLHLLRAGRHFRLNPRVKLIVGRNERDNAILEAAADVSDVVLKPADVLGPTGLMPGAASEADLRRAASICARYCDAPRDRPVTLSIRSARVVQRLDVMPAADAEIEALRI